VVKVDFIVIIQVRIAASRARRRDDVRPTANVNMIRGGLTFRLKGPHSRLNETHEERRGYEKKERARGPEVEGEKNRSWSTQPVFTYGD